MRMWMGGFWLRLYRLDRGCYDGICSYGSCASCISYSLCTGSLLRAEVRPFIIRHCHPVVTVNLYHSHPYETLLTAVYHAFHDAYAPDVKRKAYGMSVSRIRFNRFLSPSLNQTAWALAAPVPREPHVDRPIRRGLKNTLLKPVLSRCWPSLPQAGKG